MIAAVVLLGMLLYGMPLVRVLDRRVEGATFLGASFLAGAGAVTLHLFALSLVRIPWSRTSVILSMVPLLVLAWRFQPPRSKTLLKPNFHVVDLLAAIALIAYAIYALSGAPYEWDFFGIWGLKARQFFDHGGVWWRFLRVNVSHPDYPLGVPLLFDSLAIFQGAWDDRWLGLLYVALAAAFLGVVRGESKSPYVMLAVIFPALNLWVGLAEGMVMAFGCAGLLLVRRGSYTLGAVLLGLSAWSKNEGLALFGVAAIALFLATRSIKPLLRLWPAAAIIAPWMIARSVYKLSTDFLEGDVLGRVVQRLEHLDLVARAFINSPPDQPWFWAVALLVILLFAWRKEQFLLFTLLLQLGLIVGQALATRWDLNAHISLTMNRLPSQIAPAVAFLAATVLWDRILSGAKDQRSPHDEAASARVS